MNYTKKSMTNIEIKKQAFSLYNDNLVISWGGVTRKRFGANATMRERIHLSHASYTKNLLDVIAVRKSAAIGL